MTRVGEVERGEHAARPQGTAPARTAHTFKLRFSLLRTIRNNGPDSDHTCRLVFYATLGHHTLVSRAERSASKAKWCAADTDLGLTRDRRSNVRKSGKPDLRGPFPGCGGPGSAMHPSLTLALHRVRDRR